MGAELGIATSFVGNVFRHLTPAKSPFFWVVLSAVFGLVFSSDDVFDDEKWIYIVVPIYLVIASSLFLALLSRQQYPLDEYPDHIRFARSFGLSLAMFCFVMFGRLFEGYGVYFWVNYWTCVFQVGLFLLYAYARHHKENESEDFNLIQLSLITTTLLLGGAFCLSNVELEKSTSLDSKSGSHSSTSKYDSATVTIKNLLPEPIEFASPGFFLEGAELDPFELAEKPDTSAIPPGAIREFVIAPRAQYLIPVESKLTFAFKMPDGATVTSESMAEADVLHRTISITRNPTRVLEITPFEVQIEAPIIEMEEDENSGQSVMHIAKPKLRAPYDARDLFEPISPQSERIAFVGASLYFFWLLCMLRWILHLRQLVKVSVLIPK